MTKHHCPFCNSELEECHKILYIDYSCSNFDHTFIKRIVQKDKSLWRVKIRFTEPNGEKLYLQIYFKEGFTEVWKHSNNMPRTKVNCVFEPDYNNPESIRNKIRTLLVFS